MTIVSKIKIIEDGNLKSGFTLIELLVAIAIVGVISVVSVNLLFTTVLSRARQNSIQYASEDVRSFLEIASKSIKASSGITVSATQLKTSVDSGSADKCRIFKYSGSVIQLAEDLPSTCNPTVFTTISDPKTIIDIANSKFELVSGSTKAVTITIKGKHTDAFGQHDFSYNTVVAQRTN